MAIRMPEETRTAILTALFQAHARAKAYSMACKQHPDLIELLDATHGLLGARLDDPRYVECYELNMRQLSEHQAVIRDAIGNT